MWGGIAGIQHGMPLLLSRERWSSDRRANEKSHPPKLSPSWLPAISETVAKRFRLPNKGGLVAGHDADFMVLAKNAFTIERSYLLTRHPISPYIGMTSAVSVVATYLRGQKITPQTRGKFLSPQVQ